MATRCLSVLCCSIALAALQVSAVSAASAVSAQHEKRCTYAVAGDLVGYEVELEPVDLEPDGRKSYVYSIDSLSGCQLNGVSAHVCDTYAPEVDVEANLKQVTVRRLGPRWHTIQLKLVLYCDPPHTVSPDEDSVVNSDVDSHVIHAVTSEPLVDL